jgi:rhamnosyltransferase
MVSVIVRSRNEEKYVGHCLQSITDFIGKPEIILIDNESEDNTIRVVNNFEYHNVKKTDIQSNDYSPGKALNIGIKNATKDFILILSAHCEIIQLDLDKLITHFLDDSVVGVWGKQIPIWNGKKISRRYMWSNFGDRDEVNYFCESEDRYFFHNAFSFFRKDYLKENLFDEFYSSKEDRYWANEEIEKGNKIVYDSEQIVKHHYTDNGATWKGIG